jgi:hypothetical protein
MSDSEERLARLLKQVVPDPRSELSAEQVTQPAGARTGRSWAKPVLAGAAVLVVAAGAGSLADHHMGQPSRSADLAASSASAVPSPSGSPVAAPTASPVAAPTASPSGATSAVPVPSGSPTAVATASATPVPSGSVVMVPNVVGETRAAASRVMSAAALGVVISYVTSHDEAAGTVVAQEPAAGTQAGAGSMVTLRVAKS